MLKQIHRALVRNSFTRRHEWRLVCSMKRLLDAPDAYVDLMSIVRTRHPVAILDLGAFHGNTVARFLDECSIPIHAFEPTPASAEFIRQRFAGVRQVRVHEAALSDRLGVATFHENQNPQTNSLLDNDRGNVEAFSCSTRPVGTYEVKTITLDGWLAENIPEGPVVIKSDIQGAEGLLVDGGKDAFRERVIAFYSEAQIGAMYAGQMDFWTLHKRLTTEFGFRLSQIYPCLCNENGEAVQTDVLWIKPAG